MHTPKTASLLLLTAALTACGGTTPTQSHGTISITTSVNSTSLPTPQTLDATHIIPGQFIIRLHDRPATPPHHD